MFFIFYLMEVWIVPYNIYLTMYRTVKQPDHARADLLGYVAVHVLVAEKKLGRPLRKDEHVHHRDFNPTNNDEENLIVLHEQDHRNFPRMQALFLLERGLYDEFFQWWKENHELLDQVHVTMIQIAAIEEKIQRVRVVEDE